MILRNGKLMSIDIAEGAAKRTAKDTSSKATIHKIDAWLRERNLLSTRRGIEFAKHRNPKPEDK